MTKKQNDVESWIKQLWRPAIAWAFVAIILFDFIIGPVIVLAMIKAGVTIAMWKSLTLDASGFFYLAIGSILTASSWTRGQEKIARMRQQWNAAKSDQSSTDQSDPTDDTTKN